MPILKSAGAVIFRRESRTRTPKENKFPTGQASSVRGRGGNIYYLLLNYAAIGKVKKTYWGFSKGTIEKGEKEIDTIVREIREETGIKDLDFLEGFKETEKYFFKHKRKNFFKTVFYLLAETKVKKIRISFEHLGYEWLPYEEALGKLSFQNAKKILKKANIFLKKQNT
jgi:8-oxo-dGTP pyrophosphatase MutT (NUDIX family)